MPRRTSAKTRSVASRSSAETSSTTSATRSRRRSTRTRTRSRLPTSRSSKASSKRAARPSRSKTTRRFRTCRDVSRKRLIASPASCMARTRPLPADRTAGRRDRRGRPRPTIRAGRTAASSTPSSKRPAADKPRGLRMKAAASSSDDRRRFHARVAPRSVPWARRRPEAEIGRRGAEDAEDSGFCARWSRRSLGARGDEIVRDDLAERAGEVSPGSRPLPFEVDGLALHDSGPDCEELVGELVALVVREEEPVALCFHRVTAGHDVDEQAPLGEPVDGGRQTRRRGRRGDSRANGDEELEPSGQWDHRRRDGPRVLTRPTRWQQAARRRTPARRPPKRSASSIRPRRGERRAPSRESDRRRGSAGTRRCSWPVPQPPSSAASITPASITPASTEASLPPSLVASTSDDPSRVEPSWSDASGVASAAASPSLPASGLPVVASPAAPSWAFPSALPPSAGSGRELSSPVHARSGTEPPAKRAPNTSANRLNRMNVSPERKTKFEGNARRSVNDLGAPEEDVLGFAMPGGELWSALRSTLELGVVVVHDQLCVVRPVPVDAKRLLRGAADRRRGRDVVRER